MAAARGLRPGPVLWVAGLVAGVALVAGGAVVARELVAGRAAGKSGDGSAYVLALPGVLRAEQVTVAIVSSGCGDPVYGSGFPVAAGYLATAAHVVAGSSAVLVRTQGGQSVPAQVVLFDPDLDVAVLRAPGLAAAGVAWAEPAAGMSAAVIGYPQGGRETAVAASIVERMKLDGRDIYGARVVSRDVGVLSAPVAPGFSGGPVVDGDGRVVGLVYGASDGTPGRSFALTYSGIRDDVDWGVHSSAPTVAGRCRA